MSRPPTQFIVVSNLPAVGRPVRAPRTDIYETRDEFVLALDLPGVARERLDLKLDGRRLHVFGRRATPESAEHLLGASAPYDYARSFVLPEGIDLSSLAAELKDGVLTLRLPKRDWGRRGRFTIEIR